MATTPQPKRITLLPWLVGLVALIAVVVGFDTWRQEGATPESSIPESKLPVGNDPTPVQRNQRPDLTASIPESTPNPGSQPAPFYLADPEVVQDPDLQLALTASYTWYEGASGFQRGVGEAQREGKALAVYFYTDWCPYCRELESELLSRAKVEDFLKYLVKIRINPESGSRERVVANEYGVRGYPSFFIQSAPGATPRKIRRTNRDGLMSPEAFVETLDRATR